MLADRDVYIHTCTLAKRYVRVYTRKLLELVAFVSENTRKKGRSLNNPGL